jgi:23S rRNA pseudouridine1911/1915/1917 synthase
VAEAPRESLVVPREAAGERLDRFLARALALKADRARALVDSGQVRIRGKTCSPHRKLFGGEEIVISRPPPAPAAPAVDAAAAAPGAAVVALAALAVLYEDADCLVVGKPAGLPVAPAYAGARSVLSAAAALGSFHVDGRAEPGLPHRLDRDTTGALLLARHDRALAALLAAFGAAAIEKEYLALVGGEPPDEGALDTAYGRSRTDPRRFTTRVSTPRRARLSFRVERRLAGAALLRVRLETGRTHQIRVQLAEAGYPVLGDLVYGVASPVIARQALHAERLAFPRPSDGTRIEVRAPLPEDLAGALAALAT